MAHDAKDLVLDIFDANLYMYMTSFDTPCYCLILLETGHLLPFAISIGCSCICILASVMITKPKVI